jgi:hypothetical protein
MTCKEIKDIPPGEWWKKGIEVVGCTFFSVDGTPAAAIVVDIGSSEADRKVIFMNCCWIYCTCEYSGALFVKNAETEVRGCTAY